MARRELKSSGIVLSLELAIDDPQRREILLDAVPAKKISELEDRIGMSIDHLRGQDKLEQPLRRVVLGFFGSAAIPDRPHVAAEELETGNTTERPVSLPKKSRECR